VAHELTRRSFSAAIAGGLLTGCVTHAQKDGTASRLLARPAGTATAREAGLHPLHLREQRDSLLYIPKSADAAKPAPLLIYLHGATGAEQQGIRRLSSFADDLGFLLLSPASRGTTWDAIQGSYGVDVRTIDQALAAVFAARRVDARRIAVSGFSDGASYALGLAMSNGDLLGSALAFSPGFIPPGGDTIGKPRMFVSHGTADQILPIASCSRRMVPELKREGYDVTYREFDGPHTVPREMIEEGLRWFLGS
jgi:phospholipase/carboxylesterase